MSTFEYKGWHIEYRPKPIPSQAFDWDYWHDDYDGENGLAGTASSIDDAVVDIDGR